MPEIIVTVKPGHALKLINFILARRKEERRRYFFLGWCAGVLTGIAALLLVRVLG